MKKYIFILLITLFSCNSNTLNLNNIISNNSKYIGKMVDSTTRFDGVKVDNNKFYYNYSLSNCREDQDEFTNKLIEKAISENLKSIIETLPEFKELGQMGFDIVFSYKCFDGRKIAEIEFLYIDNHFKYNREDSEWNDVVDKAMPLMNSLQ